MQLNDLIKELRETTIESRISLIESKMSLIKSIYSVKKINRLILSLFLFENKFIEVNEKNSWRILGINEVENAEQELNVDFVSKKILPIVDCFDNDYIVFDFSSECFCMFNIVDEISFPLPESTQLILDSIGEQLGA